MEKNPLKQIKTDRDLEKVRCAFQYSADREPRKYPTKAALAKAVDMTTHRHTLNKKLKILEENGEIVIHSDGSLEATEMLARNPAYLSEARKIQKELLDGMKYKGEKTTFDHLIEQLPTALNEHIGKHAPDAIARDLFESIVFDMVSKFGREEGFARAQKYLDELKKKI